MKSNKFTNNLTNASLHTTGFAEAGGGTFGASSNESFNRRKQLEHNRRLVRGYGDSLIVKGFNARSSVRVPVRPSSQPVAFNRQAHNAAAGSTFREPPRRGYNPYA